MLRSHGILAMVGDTGVRHEYQSIDAILRFGLQHNLRLDGRLIDL